MHNLGSVCFCKEKHVTDCNKHTVVDINGNITISAALNVHGILCITLQP